MTARTATTFRCVIYGLGATWLIWCGFKIHQDRHEAATYIAKANAEIAALDAKHRGEMAALDQTAEAERRLKRWAFGECQSRGGVPVMGFGPAVTCIRSPLFDSWTVGLDDPPGTMRKPDGVAKDVSYDQFTGNARCFDVGKNEPWEAVREILCKRTP